MAIYLVSMNMISVTIILYCILTHVLSQKPPDDCVLNWGKCGGKNYNGSTVCCLYTRYFCNASDAYYSECVPMPLKPLAPAPASEWCGTEGKTLNKSKLSDPDNVSPLEIAYIWASATEGLEYGAPNYAIGGNSTCIPAVTIALGECGHPMSSPWMSITDPVCNFDASGGGGIWQVTSADGDDTMLAGCNQGEDPCCDARLAWAHAWNQGGAIVTPKDYCSHESDCIQISTTCNGNGTMRAWNNPIIDQKYKNNALIPNCSITINPWYPDNGTSLANITVDQEPCWFGPFSVAAGGYNKEFFDGFYGWGGYFQHYTNSKAGMCDDSPQCVGFTNCASDTRWGPYPYYVDLAVSACKAAFG